MGKIATAVDAILGLGRRYPEVGKGVRVTDPKTGKEFMTKEPSAEEQWLKKERERVNKAIKKGEYSPYFDVSQRYYADPSSYDLPGTTLTEAMPKKQATIDKWREKFDTPDARKALNEAYESGLKSGNADRWYAVGQIQDEYVKNLGLEEGLARFKTDFADAMAATTGGADPGANFLMSVYGNYLRERGLPNPTGAYQMPHPIGGRYATGNIGMYDRVIREGQGLTAAGTPKRYNFSANFLGDINRATIDEQMTRGMAGMNAPPKGTYGILENIVAEEAAKRGIPSAEMQDVAWAGFKGAEGKPMMEWVNESIARTAEITGQPQEEVVRNWIVNRGPLYGGATAAVGAGALAPERARAADVGSIRAMEYPTLYNIGQGIRRVHSSLPPQFQAIAPGPGIAEYLEQFGTGGSIAERMRRAYGATLDIL